MFVEGPGGEGFDGFFPAPFSCVHAHMHDARNWLVLLVLLLSEAVRMMGIRGQQQQWLHG